MSDAQQPPGISNENRTGRAATALAPVFIYSGYRTSSTWLWNKFRKDVNACAYYEPFNEILAGLKPDAILSVRPGSWRSHHPTDAAYMAEYAALLGNDPGVPLFPHGDPDGERYVGAQGIDGPLDPDIIAYVSSLIDSAQARGRIPLLACTRMLGRSAGLSSAFGGCHILLIRNLFQQWCSYSGQLRFGNDYFFRRLHNSLNLAAKINYISYLRGFFSDNEISDFSTWMNQINHDRIFCYFVAFHAYFLMITRRQANIVIDVNNLARKGFNYQEEISDRVAEITGLRIDLGDVRESVDYPVQPLRSTDDCRMLLKTMVDRFLLSEARDDEDRRFVEGLIADLWEEHARFTAATAGAAEVIAGETARAQDEGRRRAEAEALQAQANATLAALESESAAKIDTMKAKIDGELAEAQSAAAEASSQLEATLQQVARLERALADEAQSHAAALAEAQSAAAEASSQLEATLQQVPRLERALADEAHARATANSAAQAAAALASSRLDTAMRDLARLEREGAEQVRSHALALGAANDRIAATESTLADANTRLAALQQDHLGLSRENGRLEGQLAAQVEVNAARLADVAAVRRDLASRLTRSERALAIAQAATAGLRTELGMQARDHGAALAAADAREAKQAAAIATLNSEVDRVGHAAKSLSRELSETAEQRRGLAEQNNELVIQRDGLAAALAAAQSAAAEALSQLEATLQQVARLEHGLAGEAQAHSAALAAAREQAAHQVQVLQSDIVHLRDHIAWRERQLQHAAVLLTATPDPLAGLPRLLAALVHKVVGVTRIASVADHQQAVTHWHAAAFLPALPELPQANDLVLDDNIPIGDGALMDGQHDYEDACSQQFPITSVSRLLAPQDRQFILTAYQAVLGRAPDAEGESYYLSRLRAGEHKLTILKQLRQSPEGRAFIPGVAGLDRAIRRHVWATLPVLGILFRLLRGDEGKSATHRYLRFLANDLGRVRTDYIGLRLEQAGLISLVRELAQSAFQIDAAQAQAAAEVAEAQFSLAQANARLAELEYEVALSKQDAPVSQSAAEPHSETVAITEAASGATQASASHEVQVVLPLPRGSRTVYIYVEHTASCSTNTGVQRVTRGLAKGLLAQGERVRFVKWHAASQRCIFINAEERQHIARWNGPEVSADEHALYRPEGEPRFPVEFSPAGENNWLIVPEVTHITFQPHPVTLDLLVWAKCAGLRSGVVFYDAIPLRRPELDPVVPVHTRYMQQLLLADVIWPISDWSKLDLQAFWIGHERVDSATMPETYTLHLPGDSTISERVMLQQDGEPMILSVGSIEPRKNQVQLLKAFAAYREKNPGTPWRLVLVGNLHPAVAEEVANATCIGSGIQHLGHVSDQELVDLYSRCAFTVFPSVEEGFGLPILESLWFGKPCICANFGAMAEVANGGGCLQVDTRDVAALEDGVRKLVEDERLRRSLAQQAVDRPILSWGDYAGAITARIDREGQPGLRMGMVYFWVDATLEFSKNTGIQRVARQLARSMIAMGMRLVPVKWSATEGIGPVSAEELEFFGRWNGPSADSWHPWAHPEHAGAGAWFFMPELPMNRAPSERSQVMAVCRRYGIRTAAIFHDAIPWKMRTIYPPPYTEAHGAYMLQLADYDLVLPNSMSSGRDLVDFLAAAIARPLGLTDKIKAVPLAGQFPESERVTVGPASHDGPLRVLCVGTVEPRKNHENLLRAFALACQRPDVNLQLTIVGGPHSIEAALPERVRAFVATHPNINWEENADDARLRELYQQCDFTVYPSIEEGFGLPILESLWYARPCICADFGAMFEVAEGGGCLTVDVRDPEALADALSRMASEQRLREYLVQQAITRPFKSWADYATEVAIWMAKVTPPLPPSPLLLTPAQVDGYRVAMRLQPRPKLSVCISTYNRAEWLSSSLRNWLRLYPQPLPGVELLVCDNASTDNTPDVVAPYLQRPDFIYHRNTQNVGMLGNLRETAHNASGEYVWIVGDDDLLLPGAIERVLRAIDEHKDIALVYLNYAYTHEDDARRVTDFDAFFAEATPIVPPEPDRYGPIREICARNENFFTAIYALVFRRDHAIRAYSQDTSGRPFSSMPTCIPTTHYVLGHMMDAPGLWVGTPQIVVNMNVSWAKYAPLWILERIPELYDRMEHAGVRSEDMDRWRAHTLPGVVHFFQDIYRDDPVGNAELFNPERLVRRFKHLPQFAEVLPVLESAYARAHTDGHVAAYRHPGKVFPKAE